MSDAQRSPTAAFIEALDVPRNAKRGFTIGSGLALVVLFVFVVLPGTTRSPVLYLALAFVLAVSTGAVVTGVLTAVSAYQLADDL